MTAGSERTTVGLQGNVMADNNSCVGLMTMKDWKKKLAEDKEAKGYY